MSYSCPPGPGAATLMRNVFALSRATVASMDALAEESEKESSDDDDDEEEEEVEQADEEKEADSWCELVRGVVRNWIGKEV